MQDDFNATTSTHGAEDSDGLTNSNQEEEEDQEDNRPQKRLRKDNRNIDTDPCYSSQNIGYTGTFPRSFHVANTTRSARTAPARRPSCPGVENLK